MVCCLFATFSLPFIAVAAYRLLPLTLGDILFFSTQFIFPYDMLVRSKEYPFGEVFRRGTALTLTVLQWTIVSVMFAWFGRRIRKLHCRVALAAITVFAVTVAMHLAFAIIGIEVKLDGP